MLKKIITASLTLFITVSVVYLIADRIGIGIGNRGETTDADHIRPDEAPNPKQKDVNPGGARQVIVYYFHGNARCFTCLQLEKFTGEAVRYQFSRELQEGRIIFRSVNIDIPDNSGYISRYGLYARAVVIVDQFEGREIRWKRLDSAPALLGNKSQFNAYIKNSVRSFMDHGHG